MEFKGAEAIVIVKGNKVIKKRIRKTYRVNKLDEKIRKERNRKEVKILKKLENKLPVPKVFKTTTYSFTMSYIAGDRVSLTKEKAKKLGEYLSILHSNDVIHGDFTPANIIEGDKLYVIDFGLSFISKRIEDKADDLYTSLKAFSGFEEAFLEGYKTYPDWERILKRVEKIKERARYT